MFKYLCDYLDPVVYLCFIIDVLFFRERGMFLLEVMFDYHPIHLMALFLNPRTRKMKQCTNDQRTSCLEYIKEEMIMFDALDGDAQQNDDNNKSIIRTIPKDDCTLRIMHHYYEEEDAESDLPTTAAAIHQLEIDNYLKFGIYIYQNDRMHLLILLQMNENIIHYTFGNLIARHIHVYQELLNEFLQYQQPVLALNGNFRWQGIL